MLDCIDKDGPFIENEYHRVDKPFDRFRRMCYHGIGYDEASGLDDDAMRKELGALAQENAGLPYAVQKARAFAHVLDHTRPLVGSGRRPLRSPWPPGIIDPGAGFLVGLRPKSGASAFVASHYGVTSQVVQQTCSPQCRESKFLWATGGAVHRLSLFHREDWGKCRNADWRS